MDSLTLANNTFILDSLLLFVAIGIVFFVGAVLIMVVMFGWSMKNVLKNSKGVLSLLIISLSIPLVIGQLHQKTNLFSKASLKTEIYALQVLPVNDKTVMVSFSTSEPVIAHLEYQDYKSHEIIPVLPTETLKKRTDHSFLVDKLGQSGGEAIIVINGKRFFINGEPIRIK